MPKGENFVGKKGIGRRKGVPNRRTIDALEREKIALQLAEDGSPAARRALRAAMAGRKLAKDELEEVLPTIKGIVAIRQRKIMALNAQGQTVELEGATAHDWDKFKEWLEFFVTTCYRLSDFQSPKFKAIMVTAPQLDPVGPQGRVIENQSNVIDITDSIAVARIYQQTIKAVR